ncbi:glycosyltransferase family 4 protein [Vibrio fluvialis]|uniref:glycosyltransferase family 4 protein n=1 Tax=Vibrio fluvialis TaxID=676 RepID=UPI001404A239|nr:glycosyltransferase family 4 protein [Vibrio fluvialis]NHN74930.1 glycosyltransferase family 4 protein [Vibrio fluvialis]
MRILYIGDFHQASGPSYVDVALKSHFQESTEHSYKFWQIEKKVTLSFIREAVNADVIHVSGVSTLGFIAMLLGRMLDKLCTLTVHGSLTEESRYRSVSNWRRFLERRLIQCAHITFPVSSLLADKLGMKKECVIPNGIDNFKFSEKEKHPFDIVIIGGGRRQKRHPEVCNAIEYVIQHSGLDIQVHLFGEKGEDSEALHHFSFVHDHGYRPKKDILRYLTTAKLFIQYSEFDSFSLAVAEAINCNCYIITSCNVGINEYVHPSESYQVVSNSCELEAAISVAMHSTQKPQISHNLLTWEQVANKYSRCWSKVE